MNDNGTDVAKLSTITLGMGCFWSPEALFGSLPGVVRTRVGYAGGTTEHPTYREMGDHSETVELDFDPEILSYEALLETFWNHHNPININGYKGRQYQSLLLFRDRQQEEAFRRAKERMEAEKGRPLETEIVPFRGFTPAEPRHQKYYLKRYPDAIAKLSELYSSEEELTNSTLAARLNGLAKGFANRERLIGEIGQWPLDPVARDDLVALVRRIRW
ncbi:peptide-methionine (S)-S-oxide reductase MsrA [Cohnella xylanilytica]|uniref:Peptide methionine sulfoxide reductase MsrA n=1 Tax=Cohnella xylanilytica TaxID=557555 RepID=A0A841U5K2_9BACL|nr:peptide-methionine (S)-S-oxide reductase MsrA [Cohnella xylanilytica]MBB6693573.1 peptide-methionine (S)-S-oxide reductase MsrA [Cohnella xylanilytica]